MPHTESTEASVADILKTLESKEATCKDRCNAYNQLTRYILQNSSLFFACEGPSTYLKGSTTVNSFDFGGMKFSVFFTKDIFHAF
jgi:hypothetical protein